MGTFNGLRIGNRASKSFTWLTERMRRYELIFKLKTHTQAEVVKVLYKLERKHKGKFNDIFKTITCDNGSEFLNSEKLQRSCIKNIGVRDN